MQDAGILRKPFRLLSGSKSLVRSLAANIKRMSAFVTPSRVIYVHDRSCLGSGRKTNKHGKQTYTGKRRELKGSQKLSCMHAARHDRYLIRYLLHHSTIVSNSRSYPAGFGRKLLEIYDQVCDKPDPVLRQKRRVAAHEADWEIFGSLRVVDYDDLWPDADLWGVYLYLKQNKRLRMPQAWSTVLDEFEQEVHAATCMHMQNLASLFNGLPLEIMHVACVGSHKRPWLQAFQHAHISS